MDRGEVEGERNWSEGVVSREGEHIVLGYGEDDVPAALLAPGNSGFAVEFLTVDREVRRGVEREVDFYLVELDEPNPWAYAIYHCGTAASVYSVVHWNHRPGARR